MKTVFIQSWRRKEKNKKIIKEYKRRKIKVEGPTDTKPQIQTEVYRRRRRSTSCVGLSLKRRRLGGGCRAQPDLPKIEFSFIFSVLGLTFPPTCYPGHKYRGWLEATTEEPFIVSKSSGHPAAMCLGPGNVPYTTLPQGNHQQFLRPPWKFGSAKRIPSIIITAVSFVFQFGRVLCCTWYRWGSWRFWGQYLGLHMADELMNYEFLGHIIKEKKKSLWEVEILWR